MSSYKEAKERMNRTGNGITDPLKHSNFQEYVVNNICKHYFVLDPILSDRPNVTPWYTNDGSSSESEDATPKKKSSIFLDSDDDSSQSSIDRDVRLKTSDSDIEIIDDPNIKSRKSTSYSSPSKKRNSRGSFSPSTKYSSNDEYDTNSVLTHTTTSTHNNSSNISNLSDNTFNISSPIVADKKDRSQPKNVTSTKKQSVKKKPKLTPSEAKKIQKNIMKKKKRSIATKNSHSNDLIKLPTIDKEDRDMILESRDNQIKFEKEKHEDMKRLEEEKITIERERFIMERDTMKKIEEEKMSIERERLTMEKHTMKLKHEQMIVQNNLERSKLSLMRMEMFKERMAIKKANPEVSEDYLDEHFPYCT